MLLKPLLFAIAAVLLLIAFRRHVRRVGQPEFFIILTFELLLILLFLNIDYWFDHPTRPGQIISWFLLVASIVLALGGWYGIKKIGQPMARLKGGPHLVTQGVFRYVRHPLYSSLMFLGTGIYLKHASLPALAILLLICVFAIAAALLEEKKCLQTFGDVYTSYMKATRRFIPFII